MFLVIDGIDASGKTTQVELLSQKLQEFGKTVKVIDFPRYNEESSYFVKQYLGGKYGTEVSAQMSSLFYALDRYEASFKLKEDLQKYDFIIANRYVSSNMIHHGCKIEDTTERQNFLHWLENMEYQICGIPKPDKIFFLSLSFQNNLKLIHERASQKGITELDLHEGDKKYLQKAWQTAQEISRVYHWESIDCEEGGELLKREEITQMILEKIL